MQPGLIAADHTHLDDGLTIDPIARPLVNQLELVAHPADRAMQRHIPLVGYHNEHVLADAALRGVQR